MQMAFFYPINDDYVKLTSSFYMFFITNDFPKTIDQIELACGVVEEMMLQIKVDSNMDKINNIYKELNKR